jgi:hypothetical protein
MTPAEAAIAVIQMVERGQFDEVHERFAPQLRPLLTPDSLRAAWQAAVVTAGPVAALGPPVTEIPAPGTALVRVPVTFERETSTVAVSLAGEEWWITGIRLLPASESEPAAPWAPPPYADQGTFTEHDVAVGDGPRAVPGKLSIPHRGGPVPAPGVVLLAGSGPNDEDETIGRNKPLKDIAWGLASAGIAVLRFAKVTRAHPALVAGDATFTLTDEYVPHAVAALHLLRDQPGVDPGRVFLAGHSQGGTVAPRVAARAPAAGLVILAGGAQPLQEAMLRQFRYLASLDPAQAADLDVIAKQVAAVDDPGLSAATPASELPFGVPAAYWLDLRGYDPAAAAAELGKPVLIIQGGRDYQATVADDLSRWQAALEGRPDVTIRVYPADNHLFFPGSGPSSPAEYEPVQHVDPEVVADLASWLATH